MHHAVPRCLKIVLTVRDISDNFYKLRENWANPTALAVTTTRNQTTDNEDEVYSRDIRVNRNVRARVQSILTTFQNAGTTNGNVGVEQVSSQFKKHSGR